MADNIRAKVIGRNDVAKHLEKIRRDSKALPTNSELREQRLGQTFHRLTPQERMSKTAGAGTAVTTIGSGTVRGAPRMLFDPTNSPTSRDLPYFDDALASENSGMLHDARRWCYSASTQIVTQNGIKYIKDVTYEDEILTLNDDGYMEYHKPSHIIKKYEETLLHFKNTRIDVMCTKDQELLVGYQNRQNPSLDRPLSFIKADALNNILCEQQYHNNYYVKKNGGKWKGEDRKYFEIGEDQEILDGECQCGCGKETTVITRSNDKRGLIRGNSMRFLRGHSQTRPNKKYKFEMKNFMRFMGWYLSEGSVTRSGVVVAQIKSQEKRQEIYDCIEQMGLHPAFHKQGIYFSYLPLKTYLNALGKCRQKYIPQELKDLAPEYLEELLDAFIKGDGTRAKGTPERVTLYTSSTQLKDDLIEILLKLGKSFGVGLDPGGEKVFPNGTYICKDVWRITVPKSSFEKSFIRPAKEVEYNDYTYDVTVPNHRIYVIRNGKGCWSSNCRFFYNTHHIVPTAIDIFARYPLVGMKHKCKNEEIRKFYDELFFEDLNYEEFLLQLNTEYWKVGEVFAYGEWSKAGKIWTNDTLLNPDDVNVVYEPYTGLKHFEYVPPQHLVDICKNQRPEREFYEICMMGLTQEEMDAGIVSPLVEKFAMGENIEIQDELIAHLTHGGEPWSPRGYPILMRAFAMLMMEERFRRAETAVAERLATPFMLVTLGATAQELGTTDPWIPTQGDIQMTQTLVENALSSEYRTLVHHFGIEIKDVMAKNTAPRWDAGYDRLEKAVLAVFGISSTLLSGNSASGGNQSYANTAINAEFLQQKLKTNQSMLKQFCYEHRYRQVAEEQGFYEEDDDGKPVMQKVLIVDEDGMEHVDYKKKILYPEIEFQTIDFRDEKNQRDFMKQMRDDGMPISNDSFAFGASDLNWPEETAKYIDDQVTKKITEAKIQRRLNERIIEEGLEAYFDDNGIIKDLKSGIDTPLEAGDSQSAEDDGTPDPSSRPFVGVEKDEDGNTKTKDLEVAGTRPEQSDQQRGNEPKKIGEKIDVPKVHNKKQTKIGEFGVPAVSSLKIKKEKD